MGKIILQNYLEFINFFWKNNCIPSKKDKYPENFNYLYPNKNYEIAIINICIFVLLFTKFTFYHATRPK